MESQSECSVSGSLAVILRVSRFVGLAPLSFNKEKSGWRIRRSPALRIYGNILITVLIFLATTAIVADIVYKPTISIIMKSILGSAVRNTYTIIVLNIVAVSTYGAWDRMGTIVSCVNGIQKINDVLRVQPSSFQERKKAVFIVFWIIMTVTLNSNEFRNTIVASEDKVSFRVNLLYFFYFCLYVVLHIQILQIVIVTLQLRNIFQLINDKLNNMLQEFPKAAHSHHKEVNDLSTSFATACDLVNDIDKCYGTLQFMLMGCCFFQLILSPYYLFTSIIGNLTSISMYMELVTEVIWYLYYVATDIIIIEPCHSTHTKTQVTRKLVSNLMCCTSSMYDPLALELDLFHRHLILNEVSYSPLRVTTLQRSIIITMMVNVTNYLVIILKTTATEISDE